MKIGYYTYFHLYIQLTKTKTIVAKQTEIKDYTIMHPTKIFVMDVFEHIGEK